MSGLSSILAPAAVLGPAVVVGGAVALGLIANDPTPDVMAVQTLVDAATVTNPPNTFLIKQLWEQWRLQVVGYAASGPANTWKQMVFLRIQNNLPLKQTTLPELLQVNITYLDLPTGNIGNATWNMYSIVPEDYPTDNYGIPAPTPIQGYVLGRNV